MSAFTPRIVGFLCNWCSYAGADKAGAAGISYPPNVRVVRVMCSGRVDPQHVLTAFEQGADGVLVLACHPGDCHYQEQNYRAVARHRLVGRLLQAHGIDPRRFRFGFISAAEAQEFADTVAEMTTLLTELGPLAGARNDDVRYHDVQEEGRSTMAKVTLDFRGLNCPLPVLKLNGAVIKKEVKPGDTAEVLADCPTFEADVKKWCDTSKKMLVKCYADGSHKIALIQF
jgi:F420-non-reducing hydrogenase iron-sulfur subunit